MTKRILGALCASMLVLATGCSSTRTTTTPRTAIEVALLTRTGTEAISGFQLKNAEGASVVEGKTYKIDDARFEAVEKNFLLSKFNDKVLEAGGIKAVGDDKGTITLEPRVDFANIDDGKWFIGIPAIPLPIPTSAQVISTPEIAILSREHQKGRSQFSVYATETATGKRLFSETSPWSQRTYNRWTILVIIQFRVTNLGKPF